MSKFPTTNPNKAIYSKSNLICNGCRPVEVLYEMS